MGHAEQIILAGILRPGPLQTNVNARRALSIACIGVTGIKCLLSGFAQNTDVQGKCFQSVIQAPSLWTYS
jgi:hypothetical protein